jgi:hypothetical protein
MAERGEMELRLLFPVLLLPTLVAVVEEEEAVKHLEVLVVAATAPMAAKLFLELMEE